MFFCRPTYIILTKNEPFLFHFPENPGSRHGHLPACSSLCASQKQTPRRIGAAALHRRRNRRSRPPNTAPSGDSSCATSTPSVAFPTGRRHRQGKNRFMPPQPPHAWQEIRPAVAFGASSPQPFYDRRPESYSMFVDHWNYDLMGEDCLRLNIWTPALPTANAVRY